MQKVIGGIRQMRASKNHPLYPTKNLYEQIRFAYSFPWNISVVVLEKDGLYNIFPTDLHGENYGQNHYVISLRENGKTYEQISKVSSITLSNVPSHCFQRIYLLGKNHMQEMKPFSEVEDMIVKSNTNPHYLISNDSNQFIVLKKATEFKTGINHMNTFTIEDKITLKENRDSLSHIHEYYAL